MAYGIICFWGFARKIGAQNRSRIVSRQILPNSGNILNCRTGTVFHHHFVPPLPRRNGDYYVKIKKAGTTDEIHLRTGHFNSW